MSDDIPYAQPFPWTEESQGNDTRSLRKRKFVGSGLALLRKESLDSDSKMGNVAKNILMNLFHQHGIELDGEIESDENKFKGIGLSRRTPRPRSLNEEHETVSETRSGNTSLFIALLKGITESNTKSLSTRQILRSVCLFLEPASLPGNMDSKDMVLAALHFLSSNYETKSNHVLKFPLIRPVQAYGDLEKRNFEKVGDWKLEDIEEKLSRIEEVFLESSSSWKWQRRESLCLRLPQVDEESFFMRGTIPLSAQAKKVRGERKALMKTTKTSFLGDAAEKKIANTQTS